VLSCVVCYCIVLYCTVLYCPLLHCSTLPVGISQFSVNNNNNNNNNNNSNVFPRDIVCLRNISINTLHKGDVDDDNNNKKYICQSN